MKPNSQDRNSGLPAAALCKAVVAAFLTVFSFTSCANSAPDILVETTVLSPLSSHMVLQRDRPLTVVGEDAPNTNVRLVIGSSVYSGRAGEDGRWAVDVPRLAAGGPFDVIVHGTTRVRFSDVLVGDVWLCSGQSNMEWTLQQIGASISQSDVTALEELRLLTIPRRISLLPRTTLGSDETWEAASNEAIQRFSAACFYFGADLVAELGVPVGLVAASWGGTTIDPWLPTSALYSMPDLSEEARAIREYAANPQEGRAALQLDEDRWWYEFDPRSIPESSDDSIHAFDWIDVDKPASFDEQGLADFDGSAWYRAAFFAEDWFNSRSIALNLGCIDDRDTTWVNGFEVGRTYKWSIPRSYKVDPSIVRPGKNEVAVRVLDTGGGGGFVDCDAGVEPTVETSEGEIIRLTDWKYAAGHALLHAEPPPAIPFEMNQRAAGVLFNGMIAPITALPIRGVAWYQGESNTNSAHRYYRLLTAMANGWRNQFGQDLPFLIVQLAAYEDPYERDWPTLRQAQGKFVASDDNARLVVTIDIGERDDIHPENKVDVGRRLSLAAQNLEYDIDSAPLSPEAQGVIYNLTGIQLSFSNIGSGLSTASGSPTVKLEQCSADGTACDEVSGVLSGRNELRVDQLKWPAGQVRYAWSNYPTAQLFNSHGLPVAPFAIPFDLPNSSSDTAINQRKSE